MVVPLPSVSHRPPLQRSTPGGAGFGLLALPGITGVSWKSPAPGGDGRRPGGRDTDGATQLCDGSTRSSKVRFSFRVFGLTFRFAAGFLSGFGSSGCGRKYFR